MKYILDIGIAQTAGAASKPRSDIDTVLERAGWRRINLYDLEKKTPFRQLEMAGRLLWMKFCLKKTDLVLIQWRISLLKPFFYCEFEKLIPCRKILFIHDIDSLRQEENDFYEKDRFNRYDAVIVHTEAMKEWMREHGIYRDMFVLGIFDYLTDHQPDYNCHAGNEYAVVFAGSLSRKKSGFLYREFEPVHYRLVLYGTDYTGDLSRNRIYKGQIKPDEITGSIEGDFGLVWDGDSLDDCSGAYGRYLKYNCPHKTAMYIAAGLPVIVWSESAMAGFVRKNQVGICVDSIYDIEHVLAELSSDDYEEMLGHVKEQQAKVADGYHITKAVREIEEYLQFERAGH